MENSLSHLWDGANKYKDNVLFVNNKKKEGTPPPKDYQSAYNLLVSQVTSFIEEKNHENSVAPNNVKRVLEALFNENEREWNKTLKEKEDLLLNKKNELNRIEKEKATLFNAVSGLGSLVGLEGAPKIEEIEEKFKEKLNSVDIEIETEVETKTKELTNKISEIETMVLEPLQLGCDNTNWEKEVKEYQKEHEFVEELIVKHLLQSQDGKIERDYSGFINKLESAEQLQRRLTEQVSGSIEANDIAQYFTQKADLVKRLKDKLPALNSEWSNDIDGEFLQEDMDVLLYYILAGETMQTIYPYSNKEGIGRSKLYRVKDVVENREKERKDLTDIISGVYEGSETNGSVGELVQLHRAFSEIKDKLKIESSNYNEVLKSVENLSSELENNKQEITSLRQLIKKISEENQLSYPEYEISLSTLLADLLAQYKEHLEEVNNKATAELVVEKQKISDELDESNEQVGLFRTLLKNDDVSIKDTIESYCKLRDTIGFDFEKTPLFALHEFNVETLSVHKEKLSAIIHSDEDLPIVKSSKALLFRLILTCEKALNSKIFVQDSTIDHFNDLLNNLKKGQADLEHHFKTSTRDVFFDDFVMKSYFLKCWRGIGRMKAYADTTKIEALSSDKIKILGGYSNNEVKATVQTLFLNLQSYLLIEFECMMITPNLFTQLYADDDHLIPDNLWTPDFFDDQDVAMFYRNTKNNTIYDVNSLQLISTHEKYSKKAEVRVKDHTE